MVPLASEQETLVRIHQLRDEGLTLRAIAEALEAEGYRPKRGGQTWHPSSPVKVLRRIPADT